jgi:hypothetical protein
MYSLNNRILKGKPYFNYHWFVEGNELIFQIVNNRLYPIFQCETIIDNI